jgi:uncharacterized protein YcbK (DUF882 family)
MNHSRRDILKICASALAVSLLPMPALAAGAAATDASRRISLFNTHTGESVDIRFYDRGGYCPDA